MVAMPYILVNIVFGRLSLILFWITSAALLSQYRQTNRYLPAPLRTPRAVAFVAHALVLAVLSLVVMSAWVRLGRGFLYSSSIFDLLFSIGLINAAVLTYQFLDARYFLNTPKVRRRLLIGTVSVVTISVLAIVVVTAVVGLFIIR